jgi:hypothetical protein
MSFIDIESIKPLIDQKAFCSLKTKSSEEVDIYFPNNMALMLSFDSLEIKTEEQKMQESIKKIKDSYVIINTHFPKNDYTKLLYDQFIQSMLFPIIELTLLTLKKFGRKYFNVHFVIHIFVEIIKDTFINDNLINFVVRKYSHKEKILLSRFFSSIYHILKTMKINEENVLKDIIQKLIKN